MKRSRNGVGVARGEKRLVQSLLYGLKRNKRLGTKVIFSSEVDCFQGIADLVYAIPSGNGFVPAPTNRRLPRFSFSTAKVVAALSGRSSTTRQKLANETGLTPNTIARQLLLLRKMGIVGNHANGRLTIKRPVKHPFEVTTAFEVKVKDWTSGIYQARNYRSFADEVFLALPLRTANRLSKREKLFRRLRVGLVGIGERGELAWLIKSRRQRPVSAARSFYVALNLRRTGLGHGAIHARPS
jgi:hypothetical protein